MYSSVDLSKGILPYNDSNLPPRGNALGDSKDQIVDPKDQGWPSLVEEKRLNIDITGPAGILGPSACSILSTVLDCSSIPTEVSQPVKEAIETIKTMGEKQSLLIEALRIVNNFCQTYFIRNKKTERQDKERAQPEAVQLYSKVFSLSNDTIKDLIKKFAEMGYIDQIDPPSRPFSFIIIPGSTVKMMYSVIQFLIKLIKEEKIQSIEETEIIFLDGERILSESEKKDFSALLPKLGITDHTIPEDEREISPMFWKYLQKELPALQSKKFIATHTNKINTEVRARTEDCAKDLRSNAMVNILLAEKAAKFHKNTEDIEALLISPNPFTDYQKEVLMYAKLDFKLATAGPQAPTAGQPDEYVLWVLLDTFARRIYMAYNYMESIQNESLQKSDIFLKMV